MIARLLGDGVVVAVLLGGVLMAAAGLRRRSAAERHWLLAMAIAAALAVPALRLVAPAPLAGGIEFGSLAALAQGAQRVRVDAAPTTNTASPIFTTDLTIAAGPSTPAPRWSVGRLAVWIWVTGAIVALGRLLLALGRLRVLAAGAAPVEAGPWRTGCDELCAALGVRDHVRILHSPHPSLLATWGWRRPIVMLPRDALGWAPDRVHVVLAHELAHVARGDWRHQLAAETLRALHWCNPLVWLACRRLRLESERASDDTVLALGVDAPTFAAHLVDLARRLRPAGRPWLPAPAMVRQSSLEGRVRAMLDQTIARRPASIRARSLLAAAVVAAALPLAALGAAAQFFTVRGSLERSERPQPARRHGRPRQPGDDEPPRSPQRRDGAIRAGRPPARHVSPRGPHARLPAAQRRADRRRRRRPAAAAGGRDAAGDDHRHRGRPAGCAARRGRARSTRRRTPPGQRAAAASPGGLRGRAAGAGRRQHPAAGQGRRRVAALPRTPAAGRRRRHRDDDRDHRSDRRGQRVARSRADRIPSSRRLRPRPSGSGSSPPRSSIASRSRSRCASR